MTEFKKGDRAVVECEVSVVDAGVQPRWYQVTCASGARFWVDSGDIKVAPYRDPDLQPGQVVVPEDESDRRTWWVRRGIDGVLCFLAPTSTFGGAAYRPALPERIRVVWPR